MKYITVYIIAFFMTACGKSLDGIIIMDADPIPEQAQSCAFNFIQKGEDCTDWLVHADGTCSAACYTMYLDSNSCQPEALPKSSPIQLIDGYSYVNEDGSITWDIYRGPYVDKTFTKEECKGR